MYANPLNRRPRETTDNKTPIFKKKKKDLEGIILFYSS
jgi:hypothetical protein